MKKRSISILTILAFIPFMSVPVSIYAINEASMITLEFPSGAENNGQAESGVPLSNSIYAMFWNPAALPAVYDNLQTRIETGYFSEHPLNLKNIDHRFYTGALFFNDLLPHNIDIAYGFYKNELQIVNDNENVYSHCIGVRTFDMLSFGISLKTFDSEYTIDSSQSKSNGFAFDLGARFEYAARVASTPLVLLPETGISFVNIGGDSAVSSNGKKKPLPRGFFIGSSITAQFLEFFNYTMTAQARGTLLKLQDNYINSDETNSDYHYDGGRDLLVSLSNKVQITPFYSYGFGYMVDYNGRRFEFHDAHSITFNTRTLMAMVYRIIYRDFEPESKGLLKFQDKLSFYNGKIKPNIRFSYTTSNINSISGEVRDGQNGIDFSLGF